nr:inactive peptidyl-prolyl cis-trans isomerase FKBP6-like [Nerophis lumbriciformis]
MSINGLRKSSQQQVDGARSRTPFDLLQEHMEDILGTGGVLKEVVHPGDGPLVPTNASVLMHYSGFLEYSDLPFETTTRSKHAQFFKLGRDVTLIGMELGLLTMRKGEFSRFLLQPHYAYGDLGCPPFIPAASRVLFEIQLVEILDSGLVDQFFQMTAEEQNEVPLSKLLEAVKTLRTLANRCFKQNRYDKAKEHYKKALELLDNRVMHNDVEHQEVQAALLPLFLNLSFTALRLENPQKALKYAKSALDVDSTSTKALYRCAQAYAELRDFESAHCCLIKAQAKRPFDEDLNNLLKRVTLCCKDNLDKEKDFCAKMFPGFQNSRLTWR